MFKLIKYMRPYVLNIVFIILLLFLQANADLALPSYMSRIVDTGIQNGGISDTVPKAVSADSWQKLLMLSEGKDREKIEASYEKRKAEDIPIEERIPDFDSQKEVYVIKSGLAGDSALKTAFADSMSRAAEMKGQKITDDMKDMFIKHFIKSEYEKIGVDIDSIQMKYLVKTGMKMLLLSFGVMAAAVTVVVIAARTAAGFGRDLRNTVFRKVLSFSNSEIDKFSAASLINRCTNDIQQIQLFLVMFLRLVFYAPILGIGGIIKVMNTNSSMVWIIVLAGAAIALVIGLIFGKAVPKFKRIQKLLDRIGLTARESLTGLLVVRAFNRQDFQNERFESINKELTEDTRYAGRLTGLMMPAMMFIMNMVTILVVWFGSHQIDMGNLEIGNMMAFIQYSMQIIMAFLMISMISVMFPRSSVAALRIKEIIDTEPSIRDIEEPEEIQAEKSGDIVFSNVSFSYPHSEECVLKNLDFKIESGQTAAFIGGTGSGKSTIVKLLNRFYDVTDGSISVGGHDIRNVAQSSLREKIGYVPQKSFLFSGDIESNIKYSDINMSDSDMKRAAEISQAEEFINSKEDGYSHPIAEGGTNVSGGQKQRLSIARAVAKKPDIIVFDDSFSALDFKTERKVRDGLKKELSGTTSVIVAQRISTIRDADIIIVLDEGEIAGKGTHEELLDKCEVYREIALSQLSEEELRNE